MEEKNLIWHYTSVNHLKNILLSATLETSRFEKKFGLKKPSLWFSLNQEWEPTATKDVVNGLGKRISLTKEKQHELMGLARIGILKTSSLITWAKYKHVCGLALSVTNNMEEHGINLGSDPKDWFCSFVNVPKRLWMSVQKWDGTEWQDVEFDVE